MLYKMTLSNEMRIEMAQTIFNYRSKIDQQIIILQQKQRIENIQDKKSNEYLVNKQILSIYENSFVL